MTNTETLQDKTPDANDVQVTSNEGVNVGDVGAGEGTPEPSTPEVKAEKKGKGKGKGKGKAAKAAKIAKPEKTDNGDVGAGEGEDKGEKTKTGKFTMLKNVMHDGESYLKDESYDLDAKTVELFKEGKFI